MHRVCSSGGSKRWPGGTAPCESSGTPAPPCKIGCKVARLHNSCIHSVASHSWCQITPLIQSYITSSRILAPKCRCGYPTGHPKLLQLETPLVCSHKLKFCIQSINYISVNETHTNLAANTQRRTTHYVTGLQTRNAQMLNNRLRLLNQTIAWIALLLFTTELKLIYTYSCKFPASRNLDK